MRHERRKLPRRPETANREEKGRYMDILDVLRSTRCLSDAFREGVPFCDLVHAGQCIGRAIPKELYEADLGSLKQITRRDLSREVLTEIGLGARYALRLGNRGAAVLLPGPYSLPAGTMSEVPFLETNDARRRLLALENGVSKLLSERSFQETMAEVIAGAGQKFIMAALKRGMTPRRKPNLTKKPIS